MEGSEKNISKHVVLTHIQGFELLVLVVMASCVSV